jgi:4-amino-4-deoxy-L-arabinose transferase-like glycosyltransferase
MFSSSNKVRILVLGLLVVHAFLLLDCVHKDFVTVDEVGHVPSGISHWQTGTFAMYRVNPPLARMIAVLPVLLTEPRMNYRHLSSAPGVRSEWPVGSDFIVDNAERYLLFFQMARLSTIAWSLLGGWLILSWTRRMYGPLGGLISLTLWCFDPNVLAHAHLVTPDIPATVSGFAASYCFWIFLRRPSWSRAFLCGLLLGVALLTKLTCLLFLGIWPLLWIISRWAMTENSRPVLTDLRQGLFIVLVSVVTLNACYGFHRTCQPLESFSFVSRSLGGPPVEGGQTHEVGTWGNKFRGSWLGRILIPFPADYVCGIDVQRRDFEKGLRSYMRGEIHYRGWWYYYLYALGVKVPLGIGILVLWSILATVRALRTRSRFFDCVTIWLPAIIFLVVVSSQTGFSHHMRYVIPIFPFALVSVGRLGIVAWRGSLVSRIPIAALIAWVIVGTLNIHPHHLSYFNEVAGGPDEGHYHLVDSNIDWGQDLLNLQEWLQNHPEAQPLGLAYFGLIDPRILDIDYSLPPEGPNGLFLDDASYSRRLGPQPGYYAVSVNFVRGYTFTVADGRGSFRRLPSSAYTYFLRFKPIAKAGYSIFIYHIDLDEANRVRRELGLPLLPASSTPPFPRHSAVNRLLDSGAMPTSSHPSLGG